MEIKFTVIGLGVCVATSLDEKTIYCILGPSHIFWNDKSFSGNSDDQPLVDFILEKCGEYRFKTTFKSKIEKFIL